MRIILTRSNPIDPDPRVEKELNSMLVFGYKIRVLGWERSGKNGNRNRKILNLEKGQIPIELFHKKSSYGQGIHNLWSLFLFQIYLLKKLIHHRRNYDVIHACDFDTIIPAFVIAKLLRKKYVYDIFDYYVEAFKVPSILKPFIERMDIQMINRADAVIIVNESRIEQIRKSKPSKLWIIHNSPDRPTPTESSFISGEVARSTSKKLKFVYVGVLSTSRFLLEIAEVISQFNNAELHIGGFGELEDTFQKMSREKDNIFFYGKLDYRSVLALTEQCDVILAIYNPIVPNHRYSSPNKLYEAMLLKKPIIVAENTGIDRIVEVNHIGFVVAYDKESLRVLIKQLIQMDSTVFHAMGIRTHKLYKEKYSWTIMNGRLKSLYEQLQLKD